MRCLTWLWYIWRNLLVCLLWYDGLSTYNLIYPWIFLRSVWFLCCMILINIFSHIFIYFFGEVWGVISKRGFCMIVEFNLASNLPQWHKVEKACTMLLRVGMKIWLCRCPLNAGWRQYIIYFISSCLLKYSVFS